MANSAIYTQIYNDVVGLTNRPGLATETKIAIQAATLTLHQRDYYHKDIKEVSIDFLAANFFFQFDVSQYFPNFRQLNYLRKYDPTGVNNLSGTASGQAGDRITIVNDPNLLFDSYKLEKSDIAYVAGTTVNLRSGTQIQHLLAGYYRNPSIDPVIFDSWIAANVPYAITFKAAAMLLSGVIGHKDQGDDIEKTWLPEMYATIDRVGIPAQGM